MQEPKDVYQQAAELLAVSQAIEARLVQIRSRIGKMSPDEATAVRSMLAKLRGIAPEIDAPVDDFEFTEQELQFIETMKCRKISKHIIEFLIRTMKAVILNPQKGTRLTDSVHAEPFRCKLRKVMGPRFSQKIFIYKTNLPEHHRLIYSYGPGLARPVFLDFAGRKDIYKHNGFGKTSS